MVPEARGHGRGRRRERMKAAAVAQMVTAMAAGADEKGCWCEKQ
jgi:hypothetical protein